MTTRTNPNTQASVGLTAQRHANKEEKIIPLWRKITTYLGHGDTTPYIEAVISYLFKRNMNPDEVMSDPAPANTTMAATAPGSIQDIIDAAAAQNQSLAQIKANVWNTNKFREEYEAAKSRLSDQKFNISKSQESHGYQSLVSHFITISLTVYLPVIADYPDPLMPRAPALKQTRPGQTAESEQKLKDLIAKIKAGSGGN